MAEVFFCRIPLPPKHARFRCGCRKGGREGKNYPYVYTRTDVKDWKKQAVALIGAAKRRAGWTPLDTLALRLVIVFVRKRPGSRIANLKRGRIELCSLDSWKTGRRFLCGTLPDLDNYEKPLQDALTEAGIWHDDGQVADKHSRKFYAAKGEAPCIEIRVEAA